MPRIAPYHISGKPFGTKLLTLEQIEEIREKYPYVINKDLCEEYGVSKHVIVELAFHYSVKKSNSFRGWKTNDEPVDLVMFDWFYPKTTDKQLQEVFGKSDHFIRKLARERGLEKYEDVLSARYSKVKPRIRYSVSKTHYESDIINLKDILYVVENYHSISDRELSEAVGCERSTIVSIARYYELSKDKEILKQRRKVILVDRNKNITGRDLTPELVQQEALKYHSKREFCNKDPSAYTTANKLGIMDEVTKHMVTIAFSIPQIITRQITEYLFKSKCEYNTRKIISPYELDVYFPDLKIAFEYDGKGWHQNDEIDKIHLCKDKGIFLIKLSERSRRFKEDIQQYLVENLKLINEWCSTNITEKDILSFNEPIDFPKLFTEEEFKILRNNDVTYLRKNHKQLYERYRRYNPDNIDFKKSHHGKITWDEEQVVEGISKYSSKGELLSNNYALYQVIHKKFRHLLPLYGKSLKIKVICIETEEVFESISEASRQMGIPHQSIGKVCRGEWKQAQGKTFKILD